MAGHVVLVHSVEVRILRGQLRQTIAGVKLIEIIARVKLPDFGR
jgi:hypothetical protein